MPCEAFRYIALHNIQTGYFATALVEAGYLGEHHKFSKSAQAIEILRQDVGEHYTFSEISARLIESLKQDEVNMEANNSSIWAETKWEWRVSE
jgi:molecular chaperone DnaK (HSP70)